MKVSEKMRIQDEKVKLREKKKKTRILTSAKIILFDLILNIAVDEIAPIIDQLNTLVKAISLEATDMEKVAIRQYETKRGENLMEQIFVGKVALSTRTEEVKTTLQQVGQLLMKSSKFPVLIKDLNDNINQLQQEIQDLVSSFDPLSSSTSTFTGKIKMLNHQLGKLKDEEDKRSLSMLELQCYLAPIIDFMQLNITEADNLIHAPDCKTVDDMEVFIAILHGPFTTMKQIQSSWESSLKVAKETFPEIFSLF